jgi:hypothetical protein
MAPAEDYCVINELLTTCEAVLARQGSLDCVPSGDNTACGGAPALCRRIGLDDDQCTYECGTPDDCISGSTCAGTPMRYCGG